MIDLFQQAAAGLYEMQKVRGLLVRTKGGGVLPLLDHDETAGLLLMQVQVVLQATGFGLARRHQLAQAGLNRLGMAWPGRAVMVAIKVNGVVMADSGSSAAMLGYLIDEKNSLLLESLSIFF